MALSSLYFVKAGAVFGIIVLIAASGRERHHSFTRFGPANQVTTLRALLVSFTFAVIGEYPSVELAVVAVGFGVIVTILDGVDGWIAQTDRYGQ